MRAVHVLQALEQVHPAGPEWSFHREVFRVDALAVRLFRGAQAPHWRRVGYEVKVSRADFRNELKRPEKRADAVALTHQFYFAMPADLAERCLAEVIDRAPECGVVAIGTEPFPFDARRRSPCVGAGYAPLVKVLRPAPIRKEARPFDGYELANLIRRSQTPQDGAEELRWRLESTRSELHAERARRRRMEEDNRTAMRLLADRLGHTVEAGQRWTGPWERRGQKRADAPVEVIRVEAERFNGMWPARVALRLLNDAGEPVGGWEGTADVDLGEFLARFEQVAAVREVV